MPTYTYRCADCQHVFDEFQRISADPGAVCHSCGGEACTRQITGGTFHLKGGGWYASDYNGKTSAPAPAAPPADCNGQGPEGGCGACVDDSVATA